MSDDPKRICPICATWPSYPEREGNLRPDLHNPETKGYHHPQCCLAAPSEKEEEK